MLNNEEIELLIERLGGESNARRFISDTSMRIDYGHSWYRSGNTICFSVTAQKKEMLWWISWFMDSHIDLHSSVRNISPFVYGTNKTYNVSCIIDTAMPQKGRKHAVVYVERIRRDMSLTTLEVVFLIAQKTTKRDLEMVGVKGLLFNCNISNRDNSEIYLCLSVNENSDVLTLEVVNLELINKDESYAFVFIK